MKTLQQLERRFPAITPALRTGRMEVDEGRALAPAIVDTIREPLLVLDEGLRVVTANRAFYLTFRMKRQDVQGRPVYALGEGQWDIPELRLLLKNITSHHTVMEEYEVEEDFSEIGRRTMLMNARNVFDEENPHTTILLAIEDITERRAKERELKELLQQKEMLLQEVQHRVGNSLQIIASILLMQARMVRSEDTRLHLRDAHQRVISFAAVQQQLRVSEPDATIKLGPYLCRLCETLAASMISNCRPISLKVHVEAGAASSSHAVSLGLIVTELVMNALKHAFPGDRSDCTVIVAYERAGPSWRLTVSDNGIGGPESHSDRANPGLGMTIIQAAAKQLDARVEVLLTQQGTTVSIIHAHMASPLPVA